MNAMATTLPTIETHHRQLRDVIDDAWSAFHRANRAPWFCRIGSKLVQLHGNAEGRCVEFVDAANLYHHLDQIARWTKTMSRRQRLVRPPQTVVRGMLDGVDERLPALDVELLPAKIGGGWLVFEAESWSELVVAWWARYQDAAVTTPQLAELARARGLFKAIVPADHGASVRFGRALQAVRRQRRVLGGHMIVGPFVRNGRSAYRLTPELRAA